MEWRWFDSLTSLWNDKQEQEQTAAKADSSVALRNDKQRATATLFAGAVAADEAGG
jgi:hypothetical protein